MAKDKAPQTVLLGWLLRLLPLLKPEGWPGQPLDLLPGWVFGGWLDRLVGEGGGACMEMPADSMLKVAAGVELPCKFCWCLLNCF